MMVRFSKPEEFIAELEKEMLPGTCNIDRRIVRITYIRRPSKLSPNIQHISVVATARVVGEIYRLEHYSGDVWQIEEQDAPVYDKARSVYQYIEESCRRLGLEARAGVFEDEGSK